MRKKKKSQHGKRRMAKRRAAERRKSARMGVGAADVPETANVCAAVTVAGRRRLDLRDLPLGCDGGSDGLLEYMPDLERGAYGEIDFGHALNATRDPLAALRRARGWLAPGGTVRARFANARHIATIGALVSGKWPRGVIGDEGQTTKEQRQRAGILTNPATAGILTNPATAGILTNPATAGILANPATAGILTNSATEMTDANAKSKPLRFFTRREIEKLFYRSGYELTELRAEPNASLEAWRRAGCPAEVAAGPLKIASFSPEEAEEFLTEHFVAVARVGTRGSAEPIHRAGIPTRSAEQAEREELEEIQSLTPNAYRLTPGHGLTSIIVVTHNEFVCTRMCLESVRFVTDEPFELIVVDNASTDGTVEFLRAAGDVRLIENAENRGFPAACNQGILASRGEYIVLLNNDVIVTTGWLRRMLDALEGSGSSELGTGNAERTANQGQMTMDQ